MNPATMLLAIALGAVGLMVATKAKKTTDMARLNQWALEKKLRAFAVYKLDWDPETECIKSAGGYDLDLVIGPTGEFYRPVDGKCERALDLEEEYRNWSPP